MRKNAPKCILGAVVLSVFFALTWSSTAARLSPTPTPTTVKPVKPLSAKPALPTFRPTALFYATVTTDKAGYFAGDTVKVTGTGWQPGETVHLVYDETPYQHPPHEADAVADSSGNIYSAEYVIEAHDASSWFVLTATGLTSGLTAQARFSDANLVVDFKQGANDETTGKIQGPGNIHWIGSIVQQGNSRYFEGMSVPQRLIFLDIPATTGNNHTLTIRHQATKSNLGIHAYDFQTSWDQAIAAANAIAPGENLMMNLIVNQCGDEIGPPNDLDQTCDSLHTGGHTATPSWPDNLGTVGGDNVQPRIAAYEVCFNDRTLKIYGNAAITASSITFTGYTGDVDGNSYANYLISWTSSSSDILMEYAGHIAVGTETFCTGVGYGTGRGASSINGGPYHQILDLLDGGSLGNQDNQLKGADILVPCPTCDVSGSTGPLCPGSAAQSYTVNVHGTCSGQSTITWSLSNNTSGASFSGGNTGTTVMVNPGSSCGHFTLTSSFTCTNCTDPVTCNTTVTVSDTTPPSITCPANVTVQCDTDVPAANTADVTASDNCGTVTKSFVGDSPSGSCPKVITRTYRATDQCGNSTTCTQTITVSDTTPPSITCPGNVTVQCDSDVPGANTGAVTASDNCGTVTKTFEGDSPSGSCPKVITRTYKATDGCGNTATCTQTITVNDTTPPSITCPANVTVQCDTDVPAANTGSVTASDNCGTVTKTFEGDSPSGSCPKVITRTYKATDGCGNTATCTQTITVNDTTPPVLGTCPTNQAFCDNGVDTFTFTPPSATDNCSGTVPVTCVRSDGLALTAAYPIGTTGVRCSTQDACGNRSSCGFTVTVYQNPTCEIVPPTANPVCGTSGNPLSANVSGGTGPYDLTWSVSGIGWSIDNPPGNKANPISYTTGPSAGTATFTLVVVDANRCTHTCTLDVSCSPPQVDNCTLTQGFYGNQNGKFNGIDGPTLVQMLLTTDLTVGKPGRSLKILGGAFAADSAKCLVKRMPATQTPMCLPANLGNATLQTTNCQPDTANLPLNGQKWSNVLLGQVVTLSLNLRLDTKINEPGHVALADRGICNTFVTQGALPGPDGMLGTNDDTINPNDTPQTFSIPFSVTCALTHLGLSHTVGGLLELANRALACQCIDVTTLAEVNAAVDAVNRGYDKCRFLLSCTDTPGTCPPPASCTTASLFNPNSDRSLAAAGTVEAGPIASSLNLINQLVKNRLFFGAWAAAEVNPGYEQFNWLFRWNQPVRVLRTI